MKTYYYIDVGADGRLVGQGFYQASSWVSRLGIMQIPEPLPSLEAYWVLDGQVRHIGEPPSAHHRFDPALRKWALDVDGAWGQVRKRRHDMMVASDWVTLRAQETGQPVPPEWLAYRQALRDVTDQDDPLSIVWPVAPGG